MFLGPRPYVVLTGAKGFEAVLSSSKHITKGPDYRFHMRIAHKRKKRHWIFNYFPDFSGLGLTKVC